MKQIKSSFSSVAKNATGGGLFRLTNPSSFKANNLLKAFRNRGLI